MQRSYARGTSSSFHPRLSYHTYRKLEVPVYGFKKERIRRSQVNKMLLNICKILPVLSRMKTVCLLGTKVLYNFHGDYRIARYLMSRLDALRTVLILVFFFFEFGCLLLFGDILWCASRQDPTFSGYSAQNRMLV